MQYTINYPYNEHYEDITFICGETFDDEGYSDGYMYNYVHILSSRYDLTDEQKQLLEEVCPHIAIINIYELDVNAIALKGAGMDYSAELELAYLIIDGASPFKGDPYYFDEDRIRLLNMLRDEPWDAVEKWNQIKGEKDEIDI